MSNPMNGAWADADVVSGLDLRNKEELIDVPFLITGLWFEQNNNGVSYVYVEAEDQAGNVFAFNDSSSGVRSDLIEYLKTKKADHIVDTGETYALRLVVPKGLRKSEYTVAETNAAGRETGRMRQARTFYLTRAGERRVTPLSATAAKPKARASA